MLPSGLDLLAFIDQLISIKFSQKINEWINSPLAMEIKHEKNPDYAGLPKSLDSLESRRMSHILYGIYYIC